MRLSVVASGHRETARGMLEMLRDALGIDAAPDVTRTLLYRPEFFGKPYADGLHAAS
jgi:hypothetical protein